MQPVRIAAVSMNSPLGRQAETMEAIAGYVAQAADQGAHLALFPELVVHGHCAPDTWQLAESVPDGPAVRRLEQLAARHKIVISAGLSEKERDIVYNTQVVVGPEGYLGKQRKIHCSRDEVLYYKGGQELRTFDVGRCRVGISICYDNQFPEVPRILALKGADIILMPHAARESIWEDTPHSEHRARRHMFDYYLSCYAQRWRTFALSLADQAGGPGTSTCIPATIPTSRIIRRDMIFGPAANCWPTGRLSRFATRCSPMISTPPRWPHDSHPNYTPCTRRPELFGELTKNQSTVDAERIYSGCIYPGRIYPNGILSDRRQFQPKPITPA